MKAAQYRGVAGPAVSPIGVNRDVVRDGASSLHAETEEGGICALERIDESYSAEVQGPCVADLLREVQR